MRNLDVRSNMASADQPSVMDEAYKEFVMQLASWDTRREFWLQTDYYKQRMVGNSKADAALLDEMINNIQFIPGDFTRAVNDSVKLIAETAPDANNPVSYTHLDVYKRQPLRCVKNAVSTASWCARSRAAFCWSCRRMI